MRGGGECQEGPVLAADELLLPSERVMRAASRVVPQTRAIGLVRRQAADRVDAVGKGARPLVRREIADQIRAAPRDRLPPVARILLECGHLVGVDLVADEAGDHREPPLSASYVILAD